jgi:hypothetical protein
MARTRRRTADQFLRRLGQPPLDEEGRHVDGRHAIEERRVAILRDLLDVGASDAAGIGMKDCDRAVSECLGPDSDRVAPLVLAIEVDRNKVGNDRARRRAVLAKAGRAREGRRGPGPVEECGRVESIEFVRVRGLVVQEGG